MFHLRRVLVDRGYLFKIFELVVAREPFAEALQLLKCSSGIFQSERLRIT